MLFDAGLWPLDNEYRAIVATDRLDEAGNVSCSAEKLASWCLSRARRNYWPEKMHLALHREHKFSVELSARFTQYCPRPELLSLG